MVYKIFFAPNLLIFRIRLTEKREGEHTQMKRVMHSHKSSNIVVCHLTRQEI